MASNANKFKKERQEYLKNAYRVLLTRARQGMIIVVPNGSTEATSRRCYSIYTQVAPAPQEGQLEIP